MSKAENFTVRMDGELKQRIKDHPEINWSHVIREHVRSVLDDIEQMDQLASGSQLTEANIQEIAAMIDAGAAERVQEDLAVGDPEADQPSGEPDEDRSSRHQDITDADAT